MIIVMSLPCCWPCYRLWLSFDEATNTVAAYALLFENFKLAHKIHMLVFVVFGHWMLVCCMIIVTCCCSFVVGFDRLMKLNMIP